MVQKFKSSRVQKSETTGIASMRRLSFLFLLSVVLNSFFFSCACAEWETTPGELFWMDVPEGWEWQADAGHATITSPTGHQVIRIVFLKTEGLKTEEAARPRVDEAREAKRHELAERGGKSILKVERKVDGVYGLQTGFLVPGAEGLNQATSIVFWHAGYLFDVYFEAPREFLRMKMEAIVDTLKFEDPRVDFPVDKSESLRYDEGMTAQGSLKGEDV